ncbi:MAG: hypothetical protein CMQ45_11405 [Gammaproteobacteria bacterium]|nr:hypothetical protein [Verrucomicrobiaceae bacterium]MBK52976.1 hypothetical protein [Gammaproteobacteria bacterium]
MKYSKIFFVITGVLCTEMVSFSAVGQNADIDAALVQLLQDVEIRRYLEQQELDSLNQGRYRTKGGDTLDRIINLTMPNSRIRRSFLRQAFVQANPPAFRSSNPNRLIAGVDIRLPTAEDILALIFSTSPETIADSTAQWISFP